MEKRYNVSFIPTTKSHEIIQLAKHFTDFAGTYLLGEKSLPHVTVCQFLADEAELEEIWKNVHKAIDSHSIELVFDKVSCRTSGNLFWISLLPNKADLLNRMHNSVGGLVKNTVKKTFGFYDPHMSLLNTKIKRAPDLVSTFSKTYIPISDTFVISLGKSDNAGQLIEIIYKD